MINPERLYLLGLSTAAVRVLAALLEQAHYNCEQGFYTRYHMNFELLELGPAFEKAALPALDATNAKDELLDRGRAYFRKENGYQVSICPYELSDLLEQAEKDERNYQKKIRKGQALRTRNLSEMEERYISSLVVTPKGVLERHIKPY